MHGVASTLHFGSFLPFLLAMGFVVVRSNKNTRWPKPSLLSRIWLFKYHQPNYGVVPAAAVPPPPADEIRGEGMLPLYIELIA